MKLVRYGSSGKERPGIIDRDGRIRDLSGVLEDISCSALLPESLDLLRSIDLERVS